MGNKNSKRLCWNCDGSVPLDLTQCPYCAVAVDGAVEPAATSITKNDPLISPTPHEPWNQPSPKEPSDSLERSEKNSLTALLLLLPGAMLALFGILLLFFAKEGELTLAWKENFAYFYLIGAAPLLLLGWRRLNK